MDINLVEILTSFCHGDVTRDLALGLQAPKLAFSFSSEGALPLFEHLAPHLHELELFDFSVEQLEGCVGSLTALQSLVLNVNDDFFKRTSAQPDNGREEMQVCAGRRDDGWVQHGRIFVFGSRECCLRLL